MPIYAFCDFCSFEYDFILKYEELETEFDKFVETAGFKDFLSPSDGTKEFWKGVGMTDEQVLDLYFQQLSQEDIKGLYEKYRHDFKLFGYKFVHNGATYT